MSAEPEGTLRASSTAPRADAAAASRTDRGAPAQVPALDGFRGLAAFLVAIFHCSVFLDPPLDGGALRAIVASGRLGVDFFFVISGFVLFLPVVLAGGRFGSVAAYARRRFARIVPAYYLSVVLQVATTPLLDGFPSPLVRRGGWAVILAHLLFLQHSLPVWLVRELGYKGAVVGFGVNGVVWSLTIEACFYVALPIVAGFYFRRPRLGFAIALAGALLWRWLALGIPRLTDQFPSFLAHFAFGMSTALLYAHFASRSSARGTLLERLRLPLQIGAAALLIWSMIHAGAGRGESVHGLDPAGAPVATTVTGGASVPPAIRASDPTGADALGASFGDDLVPASLFALFLLLTTLAPPAGQRLFTNRFARWLGEVSYGAFLWHMPLILFTLRYVPGLHPRSDASFAALCALVVPASFLIGWASRRLVEDPCIRWARHTPSHD